MPEPTTRRQLLLSVRPDVRLVCEPNLVPHGKLFEINPVSVGNLHPVLFCALNCEPATSTDADSWNFLFFVKIGNPVQFIMSAAGHLNLFPSLIQLIKTHKAAFSG